MFMFFSKKKDITWTSSVEERIAKYEVNSLQDEEILSTLTGLSTEQAKEYIDQYGILELPKFVEHLDITQAQKNKIKFLYQFTTTLSTHKLTDKINIDSSTKAGELFVERLKLCRYEVFEIAYLDNQNRVITIERLHEGTINEAPVYPRLVIEAALKYNANNIVLAHNHPGGSLTPSVSDENITKKIIAALNPISMNVVDHIIVGDDKYFSFAEKKMI